MLKNNTKSQKINKMQLFRKGVITYVEKVLYFVNLFFPFTICSPW